MKINIYGIEEHNNSKYIEFSRCFKPIPINPSFHHSAKACSEIIFDFEALADLDKVVGGKSYLMRYKNFA